MSTRLVAVAVPAPLYKVFDYRAGEGMTIVAGARVRVPFGRRQVVGVAIAAPRPSEGGKSDERTYKDITEVLDADALLPGDILDLCHWAAAYYQHPLGETLASALPGPLRRGGKAAIKEPKAKK